jgi:Uma2 family endonuclease
MQALRTETVPPETYLAWEREQLTRNEYYDGLIYGMVGGTRHHSAITLNIASALKNHLRGGPCQAFASDMRVHIAAANAYFYPDVVVSCDPGDLTAKEGIRAPTAIFEVLSLSTAAFDRGDKFAAYRSAPSLKDYILIEPESKRVEIFSRNADDSWKMTDVTGGAALIIPSLAITLALEVIFENAD